MATENKNPLRRAGIDRRKIRLHRPDGKRRSPGESLRRLAGGWSAADAVEFEAATRIFDQIDKDQWR